MKAIEMFCERDWRYLSQQAASQPIVKVFVVFVNHYGQTCLKLVDTYQKTADFIYLSSLFSFSEVCATNRDSCSHKE